MPSRKGRTALGVPVILLRSYDTHSDLKVPAGFESRKLGSVCIDHPAVLLEEERPGSDNWNIFRMDPQDVTRKLLRSRGHLERLIYHEANEA